MEFSVEEEAATDRCASLGCPHKAPMNQQKLAGLGPGTVAGREDI